MSARLTRDSQLERTTPGAYERELDRSWWGFQSQFGGYAMSLGITAMSLELASAGLDASTLAPVAYTQHFLRPFTDGLFRAEVTVERAGRSVSTVTARLETAGKLCGLAIASFGTDREVEAFTDAIMPPADPPDEEPHQPGLGVESHGHFDFWPRVGLEHERGVGPAEYGGWVRPREIGPVDANLMLALGDGWTPCVLYRVTRPAITMTSDFTAHFRMPMPVGIGTPDVDPNEPLFVLLKSHKSAHGFVDEDTFIWAPDGRLLATTRQLRYFQPID